MTGSLDEALAPLRKRGQRAIMGVLAVNLLAIAPVGLLLGNPDWWAVLLAALVIFIIPIRNGWTGRNDAEARIIAGLALTACPILFVYLFRGDPWQMDTHMYFFVCFSVMVLLCDRRALLAGTALTLAHHILFFFWMPDWVFPGSGSFTRVLFHGFLVSCQVTIILVAMRDITQLTLRNREARREADDARMQAEAARSAADQARRAAEDALAVSRAAEQRAEREYHSRLAAEAALKASSDDRRIATSNEIERNVGSLVVDLREVADLFTGQADDIKSTSAVLTDEAGGLCQSAQQALGSIADMSRNAEELATSIRLVRDNACQAQTVATTTARSIATLGPGIEKLSDEVEAAYSILKLVSEIASQSNLLALNATIEAARSGEAGLGFAVVATEMKQMAAATARAAGEISDKLLGITNAAAQFRGQIDAATAQVDEITGSSSAIVVAVEQQQVATQSIARSAETVLSQVSQTDAHSYRLNEVAQRNRAIADLTINLSGQLGARAHDLNARMDELLVQLRAA